MRAVSSLATELTREIGKVAVENRELKRVLKSVRHHASAGLHQAAEEGAARWRAALDKILEITERR